MTPNKDDDSSSSPTILPTTISGSSIAGMKFFDSHHHFLDTVTNKDGFQAFLGRLVPNEVYLPAQYHTDIVEPLRAAGVTVVGSTHMECMPDDGVAETAWVEDFCRRVDSCCCCTVQAIVASVDLTRPDLEEEWNQLRRASPQRWKGVRWILDCVGKFEGGTTATHVATTRHDGIDYLRGGNPDTSTGTAAGGYYEGSVVAEFERGFSQLEAHGLSFDLQCAPVQLLAAAQLFSRYPKIPVVIDHLGKPRMVLGPDKNSNGELTNTIIPDDNELTIWRKGMQAMAALPHVYVKLSMLGYCVPGWIRNDTRKNCMRQLVRETVALFGPQRCMVATNFWKNAALSDSDGLSDVGPDPVQLLTLLNDFLGDYSREDRQDIFCNTAQKFYKVKES